MLTFAGDSNRGMRVAYYHRENGLGSRMSKTRSTAMTRIPIHQLDDDAAWIGHGLARLAQEGHGGNRNKEHEVPSGAARGSARRIVIASGDEVDANTQSITGERTSPVRVRH